MNHAKRAILGSLLFFATLLSACGPSSSVNTTNTLAAIYTEAAQTVAAQEATSTLPLLDQSVTLTPGDTPADASTPTSLPTLQVDLPTSTPYTTTLSGTCDGSSYISDVTIPDGTVEDAGQSFVKTWMFQNTGTCAWDSNFILAFVSGDQMGGTSTSVGGSIAPGQQAQLSVTLTAPTTAGQYKGYWRLENGSGGAFGETVYVLIDVNQDATATPETTDTPAYTATATPLTPTAVVSSTPVTPATNTPVTPATNTPITPPTNTPVTPPTNTPVTPAANTPVTPATNTPVTPPTNTPVTPATNTPVTPAS